MHQHLPASREDARLKLLRDIDRAVHLLFLAQYLAAGPSLTKEEYAEIQHLLGESRNVPLTISLHDLAAFDFPPPSSD
jgi:hypothetical protein